MHALISAELTHPSCKQADHITVSLATYRDRYSSRRTWDLRELIQTQPSDLIASAMGTRTSLNASHSSVFPLSHLSVLKAARGADSKYNLANEDDLDDETGVR